MDTFLKKKKYIIFIGLLSIFIISGCIKPKEEPLDKTEYMLGTICTIKVYDGDKEKAIEKSFQRIKDIENKMSVNKKGTELDLVGDKSGKEFVKVSDDTLFILEKGKYYSEKSQGVFDITIGPLVKLWGIGTDKAKIPSENEIKDKKVLVNYKDLIIDKDTKMVKLNKEGMSLDLGGIAKGYAADEVAKILRENKVNHAIINLGGNIIAMNNNVDGKPWRIGVQNPFEKNGEPVGTLDITNKTLVTSGIYERFIEKDGKKYHHILNPFTGYPMDNSLASVTLIMDESVDADAMTKNLFYKDVDKGLEHLKNLSGVEAVFVTKDKKVYITEGLKDKFKLLNKDFKLKN